MAATIRTPIASRNIYEQQFQMHRFAKDFFPRRVAVNDLGWVSYQNDVYVLDLWGLGSETARRLRFNDQLDARAVSVLVEKANVEYAMIYKSWLEDSIPDNWCHLATMRSERVTAGDEYVHFFATDASIQEDMSGALKQFAQTLPKRVTLDLEECKLSDS